MPTPPLAAVTDERVSLGTIAAQWARIGCLGFGGPPAHIHLFRRLCVTERAWMLESEFEDGIAATNLLPGPASTQLAIYCAWRLRSAAGALVGGFCFISPGLILILALAAVFLGTPARWVQGAAAGAGAAVSAVAVHAALGLVPGSWRRCTTTGGSGIAAPGRWARSRWTAYLSIGAVVGATAGPYLVLVLLLCGVLETAVRGSWPASIRPAFLPVLALPSGGLSAVSWVALKVGLLSYGGGFVIVPLMQTDAVRTYHWMSGTQFLNAVALGQITPGPVVQTVAVVGYAAAGLLAALVAFTPSFVVVLLGAKHFDRLRGEPRLQAFLSGAGPAVIGAIAGSALPLARALAHPWQFGLLAAAAAWLLILKRGVVSALLITGALGVLAVTWAGLPVA